MGVFPWSPLGRGVLTGQYRGGYAARIAGGTDHFAWFVEPYLEHRSRGVVEAVVRAAEGLDLTPLQVALLWVRDAPGGHRSAAGCPDRRPTARRPWPSRDQRDCPAGRSSPPLRRRLRRTQLTPLDPATG